MRSLPLVTRETPKALQALRDQANVAIQALRNLGRPVDTWDDLVVHLVSQNKSSRKAWELKLSDTVEFPAYAVLDSFLESRSRALYALMPVKMTGASEPLGSKPLTI